jgi:hypothetical protein
MIDEKDVAKALQRPGALPALLTSLGVFGFLLVQNVAYRLIRSGRDAFYDNQLPGPDFGSIWATELALALGIPLVFAIGVFLCLWQVAPIAANLRLAHVVTRAALAAALGAACVWVLRFLVGLVYVATTPELRRDVAESLGGVTFDAFMDSLGNLVGLLPLVVLGAVFLWGWLQRHPPKQRLAGTLDEV